MKGASILKRTGIILVEYISALGSKRLKLQKNNLFIGPWVKKSTTQKCVTVRMNQRLTTHLVGGYF